MSWSSTKYARYSACATRPASAGSRSRSDSTTRDGAWAGIGKREGMRNVTPWKRALRAKSCSEYAPFIGTSVSGAPPVSLKITPSSTGRQFTARPCRDAMASISSAPR